MTARRTPIRWRVLRERVGWRPATSTLRAGSRASHRAKEACSRPATRSSHNGCGGSEVPGKLWAVGRAASSFRRLLCGSTFDGAQAGPASSGPSGSRRRADGAVAEGPDGRGDPKFAVDRGADSRVRLAVAVPLPGYLPRTSIGRLSRSASCPPVRSPPAGTPDRCATPLRRRGPDDTLRACQATKITP